MTVSTVNGMQAALWVINNIPRVALITFIAGYNVGIAAYYICNFVGNLMMRLALKAGIGINIAHLINAIRRKNFGFIIKDVIKMEFYVIHIFTPQNTVYHKSAVFSLVLA